jgi:hypothetical protein
MQSDLSTIRCGLLLFGCWDRGTQEKDLILGLFGGSTKPSAKAPVEAPARASELVRCQRPRVDVIPNQRLPNDILVEKQGADRDDSSRMEVRAISAFSTSRGTLGRGGYLKPTAMTESFGAWFQ